MEDTRGTVTHVWCLPEHAHRVPAPRPIPPDDEPPASASTCASTRRRPQRRAHRCTRPPAAVSSSAPPAVSPDAVLDTGSFRRLFGCPVGDRSPYGPDGGGPALAPPGPRVSIDPSGEVSGEGGSRETPSVACQPLIAASAPALRLPGSQGYGIAVEMVMMRATRQVLARRSTRRHGARDPLPSAPEPPSRQMSVSISAVP